MNKVFMRALADRLMKLPSRTDAFDGQSLDDVLEPLELENDALDFMEEVLKIVEETIEEYSFSYNDTAMTTAGFRIACGECGIKYGKWQSKFGSDMDNIDLVKDQRKILPL